MKKVLISHFPNLNNYGTGMMGLVVTQYLMDHFGKDVEIFADFHTEDVVAEVLHELEGDVQLKRAKTSEPTDSKLKRQFRRISGFLTANHFRGYDLRIVLGGDDLSEYYHGAYQASLESLYLWRSNFVCPTMLLGQTIGPFHRFVNRTVVKRTLRSLNIITRDPWCYHYLKDDLGFNKVIAGADLAFCDLPHQNDASLEGQTLSKYGLEKEGYCTIIVSGLQESGYYCKDRSVYLQAWRGVIERLLARPQLAEKKICLLAHTFGWYGEEKKYCEDLYQMLPDNVKERTVLVTEKIYPLRARLILGNGLFTISGRMHATVSTFQLGKPAIALSYSKKYDGVIGEGLGRSDLILDANDESLWTSKKIVELIDEKVVYTLENHDRLKREIQSKAAEQKAIANKSLEVISSLLTK